MKEETKEAIEAIRLHALWMSGRVDELTPNNRAKEVMLWGGTDGVERGERLLNYINTITDELNHKENKA
ncbi:hypothetical protein KAU33_16015 [Candidatus Dependentiae bacterium]|nr:hypothetical protein [Candidatus Dependentiae bacterium]